MFATMARLGPGAGETHKRRKQQPEQAKMTTTDDEIHTQCMQRFIELANSMKEEDIDTRVVSAGMMTASAIYSTYVFAGNDGRLAPTGVEKLANAYRDQLERVQKAKGEKLARA
jgi:hypothetical protein